MAGLQEENAALKTILCILEHDSQADKGILCVMSQGLSHYASTQNISTVWKRVLTVPRCFRV